MKCRHCNSHLTIDLCDLGTSPPSNSYLTTEKLAEPEVYYPLKVKVCDNCWLVQTVDYVAHDDMFSQDYSYLSSTSTSWLLHAQKYTDQIVKKLGLTTSSFIVEIASNDGYLLKNFKELNIPCLGIEPTEPAASIAIEKDLDVISEFFSLRLSQEIFNRFSKKSDLIIGNNVLAHVPKINDFVAGVANLLSLDGTATFEFPHLYQLIKQNQFDTIYHEHFSYLSIISLLKVFSSVGLDIYEVEELPTHGGSLRVYVCHAGNRTIDTSVNTVLNKEIKADLNHPEGYQDFQPKIEKIKNDLLEFLLHAKKQNLKICGYGAAAKGNTFINFMGGRQDLIGQIYDSSPSKQHKYCPGSRIKILPTNDIIKYRPDYVLILPWNLKKEIKSSLEEMLGYTPKIVTSIPNLKIE